MTHIISFVAGKSGGHIIPCLSVAKQEKTQNPHTKILFFATTKALDKTILKQHPYIDYLIFLPALHMPAKKWLYPFFCWQLCFAFMKAFAYLVYIKPASLVSMGELISVPVCYAAYVLRIPITLYELNASPGKTTLWLAPLAKHIYTCFTRALSYFPAHKTSLIAYPLRFTHKDLISRQQALQKLQLRHNRKTILVIGGSQGSTTLDALMHAWVPNAHRTVKSLQIIHQTHPERVDYLRHFYNNIGIPAVVFDYYDAIELCYKAADVVICRAGAGTLFEVGFFEKPCITIPLETTATAHQYDNALSLSEQGGSQVTVLRQKTVMNDISLLNAALTRYLA